MVDQKHLENAEYFKYWTSLIPNDARRTREINFRIAMGGKNQQEKRRN